jgi:hypothetical protein
MALEDSPDLSVLTRVEVIKRDQRSIDRLSDEGS